MSDYDTMAKALFGLVEDGYCECRPVTFACKWCVGMRALPREYVDKIALSHWDDESASKAAEWLKDPRCR